MKDNVNFTSDQIIKAVESVKKIKSGYELMLDLYEKIFIEQENSKTSINIKNSDIPEEITTLKLKDKFPLINLSQFVIDNNSSEKLFRNICSILYKADEMSESVNKIIHALNEKKLNLNKLFSDFLQESEISFDTLEADLGISKEILSFIVYNSVKPSISLFSKKIAQYLPKDNEWIKGYCPICGSVAQFSTLEDNGKRFLFCSFCSHKWASKKIYCPFCENTDHETLHYYDIEDEEEYRVDVCDVCKKYIKTVDIRKTSRIIYPPLEQLSTPHLDIKIMEMGFQNPANSEYVKNQLN